jgi:hypothetical protein
MDVYHHMPEELHLSLIEDSVTRSHEASEGERKIQSDIPLILNLSSTYIVVLLDLMK